MSARVTEPYLVRGYGTIIGELLLGKWAVILHEWLGDVSDLDTWKLALLELADRAGVEVDFFDIPRKDMTIAANGSELPTFDEVAETVSAMELHRWTGRVVGISSLVMR